MMKTSGADNDGRRTSGRRSGLGRAAAALSGWVTNGRAEAAQADDPGLVRLGRRNEATAPTTIVNVAASETAVRARASGPGGIAVDGVSQRGTGVQGYSREGNGVLGESV